MPVWVSRSQSASMSLPPSMSTSVPSASHFQRRKSVVRPARAFIAANISRFSDLRFAIQTSVRGLLF
eukprot:704292-Lingulodinium_polyedra.AAC.1